MLRRKVALPSNYLANIEEGWWSQTVAVCLVDLSRTATITYGICRLYFT